MKVKKIVVDERVIDLENRIMAEIGMFLLILLPVSALVKSGILHQTFESYSFEIITGILALLYIIIRYMMKGLDLSRGINNWLSGIVGTLLVTVIGSWNNYLTYGSHYQGLLDRHFLAVVVIFFISSSLLFSIIYSSLYFLNHYNQNRLLVQIEKDE
ncbi:MULTISPECIES: DUF6773 family protein [unclassified Streptococcus]|uniref:DUF6773 family protein n=1 Tax=unclassified Streptococcus TaxID=2608887 RepID=UPI0010724049|nr:MULTISPECIES: DUF6773 family protein [unclassified Streptococcus]MBF0787233.1 hypothetical protein [Streptococcus sp. 19428wC2_LYSM12]MCQ9211919.1 hypothetical protein [Streptococcus sp. B01]MCQ9213246.1 hypothetical protein [Streptococcus sp. O1]TFV05862.1 hypothetical protein E4T79_04890 [Streptococcus sp. LYSM12]